MARLIVFVSVVFLLAAARSVEACDCPSAGPPCSAVWKADAVFVGRADRADSATVRFAVERRVRGVSSAEILVDRGPGNCAYAFAAGERYVVYAYRNRETGVLTTSICSATKPLSDAAADIAYFDELNRPSTGGRVYGRISHLEIDFETGHGVDHGPVRDLRITLSQQASTKRVATNAAGLFEVRGLAPGRYEVDIEIPPRFVPWRRASFELVNDRACVEWNSVIRFDGRIGGTLLDESGWRRTGLWKLAYSVAELPDGTVLAGTMDGVFRSSDRGMTWIERSIGLSNFDVRHLTVLDSGELFAATRVSIYRSTDGADLWRPAAAGLPRLARPAVLASGRAAVAVAGVGTEIYEFDAASETWKIAAAMASPVTSLTWDSGGRLWIGTASTGVSVMQRRGSTWTGGPAGLAAEAVHALAISDTHVIAATERETFRAVRPAAP